MFRSATVEVMRVLTLVILAVSIGSAQDNRARPIALVGGTVVDVSAFGASTGDIRDGVVIVQNGRITAVGTRRSTVIPRGAEVIDATGKFIVPGLHDVFATIDNQAYANAFHQPAGKSANRRASGVAAPDEGWVPAGIRRKSSVIEARYCKRAHGILPGPEQTHWAQCRASRCTRNWSFSSRRA